MANLKTLSVYEGPTAGDYSSQYGVFSFNTVANAAGYIHMKTNQTSTSLIITQVEALGYDYGNTGCIRCAWDFHTSGGTLYDRGRENGTGTGLTAHGMYLSADSYVVLRAYTSTYYYIGFILNAHNQSINGSFGGDFAITAAVANATAGSHY